MEKESIVAEIERLSMLFDRDKAGLILLASNDETKRHSLCFVLGTAGVLTKHGGTVTYNKKKRKFTHITFSGQGNWAIQFSIESKVYCSYGDFYRSIKHKFPFGLSIKKGTEYLLNN